MYVSLTGHALHPHPHPPIELAGVGIKNSVEYLSGRGSEIFILVGEGGYIVGGGGRSRNFGVKIKTA